MCGCASFAPLVKEGDLPDSNLSYIYGCFKQTKPSNKNRAQSGVLALSIVNNKTKAEHKIRFGWDEDVLCVPVEPGCYHVSKWYSYDFLGSEKFIELDISSHVKENDFCLEADKAYYLGDFVTRFEHNNVFLSHTYVHTLNIPENNFVARTELLNKTHSAFADIEKNNLFEKNFFKDEFNKEHILINNFDITIVPVITPAD